MSEPSTEPMPEDAAGLLSWLRHHGLEAAEWVGEEEDADLSAWLATAQDVVVVTQSNGRVLLARISGQWEFYVSREQG